jgi:uncharacterized membrane protein
MYISRLSSLFCIIFVLINNSVHSFSVSSRHATSQGFLKEKYFKYEAGRAELFGSSRPDAIPGIGDDGCAMPSLSKVNTLSVRTQGLVFFGCCLALYGGTVGLVSGIEALKHSYPATMGSWMNTWPILGPLFMLAGLSHFSMQEGFVNMMPAQGSWGLWYLPGSKKFHVAWTGIVEFLAGLWLTIGASSDLLFGISLPDAFELGTGSVISDASFVLLALVIAVTPANIYMFTHGALLPPAMMTPVPLGGSYFIIIGII